MSQDFSHGPILCQVKVDVVDGEVISIALHPISDEQTVELSEDPSKNHFVTILAAVPLFPLSIWEPK